MPGAIERPQPGVAAVGALPPIGSAFAVRRRRVTIEQIRIAYDARPFVPFVLHLADGRGLVVRSREFVLTPPSGRTLEVHQSDGRRSVVDLLLVTDLEFEGPHDGEPLSLP